VAFQIFFWKFSLKSISLQIYTYVGLIIFSLKIEVFAIVYLKMIKDNQDWNFKNNSWEKKVVLIMWPYLFDIVDICSVKKALDGVSETS